MTTTVKITTHTWPVEITAYEEHSWSEPKHSGSNSRMSKVFVPANSEHSDCVHATRHIVVRELPEGTTELPVRGLLHD